MLFTSRSFSSVIPTLLIYLEIGACYRRHSANIYREALFGLKRLQSENELDDV